MKFSLYLLLLLQTLSLYGVEKMPLFVPKEEHPFFLNSPTGKVSVESSKMPWEYKWRLETAGDGQNVQMTALDLPDFSLNQKNLVIWVKTENRENLREFWLFAADSEDFSNRVVFMVSDDKTQLLDREWTKITLPFSAGKQWGAPDLDHMKTFQFWINDNGKAPGTAVEIGPVYTEMAEEPSAVVITFDDGWLSQYQKAAPIMAEYGFRGTAYLIPELIGQENYMTLEDLKDLTGTYQWSLGGHYLGRMDGREPGELNRIFYDQAAWFSERGLEAADFSYPNGAFSPALLEVLPAFFRSARTIIEYPEANPPANPYILKVMNLTAPFNSETLQNRLDRVAPRGELVILVLHKIEESSAAETEMPTEDFRRICEIISRSGLAVKTMAEISGDFKPLSVDWEPLPTSLTADTPPPEELLPEEPPLMKDPLKTDSPQLSTPLPVPLKGLETQIDFSLDWRMVWGTLDGEAGYYNQIDDLHMYVENSLSDYTKLFTVFGIQDVNFEDFSEGAIDGSYFYLNALYMVQEVYEDTEITAGYTAPDPVHKWLQVTRSAGIEPAFGQDMAPRSLWIGGKWEGLEPYGVQLAVVPDVIGKENEGDTKQVMTYQEELGVPNVFGSLWIDTETFDMEAAAALNGDALKAAAGAGYVYRFAPYSLSVTAGIKYTKGEDFQTYPVWDHLDNAWRLSSGVSGAIPLGEVTFNPGLAWQSVIYDGGDVRHLGGIDVGFLYKILELYGVVTLYDLENSVWEENAGLEAGLIVDYRGVEYMTGYTMAGFNTLSGLYNNKSWNEGGVDGVFLRIKATYW